MKSKLRVFADDYLQLNNTYEKDIQLYINYIDKKIIKGDNPENISKEDITNSVKYYNNLKKIGTSNTLVRYLSGIKSFYNYLVEIKEMEDLFSQTYIASIKDYINEICKDVEISFKAISNRTPFPRETIIEILENLDTHDYDKFLKSSSEREQQWYYKYKMLRLFIKLTLIAPAKKNIITKITLKQIDLESRLVNINKILINIPNGLYRDLIEYLDIRIKYNKLNNIDDDLLFMHSQNTLKITDTDLNLWFGEFLHEYGIVDISKKKKKSYYSSVEYESGYSCPIEPIMNSALQNLIMNGADISLIAKISGVKEAQIIDKFFDGKNFGVVAHELINNEISKNYYYKFI